MYQCQINRDDRVSNAPRLSLQRSGEQRGLARKTERGGTGGDEEGLALADGGVAHESAALGTEEDKEAVARGVNGGVALDVEPTNGEIGTGDEGADELCAVVGGAIVVVDGVVDGIASHVDVQLTGLAVAVATVEVVDTVGDVAGLLNFGQQVACPYGVETACRDEEDVTGMALLGVDDVHQGAVAVLDGSSSSRYQLLRRDGLVQASIDSCVLVGLNNVPHLGLTHAVVTLEGEMVVGVDLDAEVLVGIDEFDQ